MALFLFLKQIVDMLYQYQWLDYFMVIFALTLFLYQAKLIGFSVSDMEKIDYIVLVLSLSATAAWFMNPAAYKTFFKVLSAYMIYFVGRIYWERIAECYSLLVMSSYLVIYLNFFYRLWRNGGVLFAGASNHGELYYYKTDMAFAVNMALLFVVVLGRRIIPKLFTALFVCPYMVFYSGARMQWIVMIIVYLVLGANLLEMITGRRIRFDLKSIIIFSCTAIAAVGFFIAMMKSELAESMGMAGWLDFSNGIWSEKITHSRFIMWPAMIRHINSGGIGRILFGFGWDTEASVLLSIIEGPAEAHCLYVKLLYCTGYLGVAAFLVFMAIVLLYALSLEERGLVWVSVGSIAIFLCSGVSDSAIIFTQMSWFPFLFAGMVISAVKDSNGAAIGEAVNYTGAEAQLREQQ